VLLSSGDSFPHLIQKPSLQLGFVTYLLNYLRICRMSNVKISETTVTSVYLGKPKKPNLREFSLFSPGFSLPVAGKNFAM
jgi:hypothetical protein